MQDSKPSTNVNASADSVLAALETIGNFVKTGGGQSATLNATDTQNKTDVNIPELMTSLNGLALQMSINHQANLNALAIKDAESANFYKDIARAAAVDARDQNHTKQALAATFPFVVAGDAAEESAKD